MRIPYKFSLALYILSLLVLSANVTLGSDPATALPRDMHPDSTEGRWRESNPRVAPDEDAAKDAKVEKRRESRKDPARKHSGHKRKIGKAGAPAKVVPRDTAGIPPATGTPGSPTGEGAPEPSRKNP
jgi:hypothetical protein